MLSGLSRRAAIVIFSLLSVPGWAHTGIDYSKQGRFYCGNQLVTALTPGALMIASIERVNRAQSIVPPPSFDYLERNQHEQVGDNIMPLSLKQAAGERAKFIANRAPGSPHPMTVRPITEENSFPMLIETHFAGHRRATAAYVTLPRSPGKSEYLIGPEYAVANVQLHGWGTPSATAANGMEQGEYLAKSDVPQIAFDQPGHGMATRNPEGLLTMTDQILLLLDQIDQTIHPSVKVNISGHSGGGMVALAMHLMSRDPKYAPRFSRIKRFFSMSPMIDASMKGDAQFNLFFQEQLEKRFDELRPQMAESDFEFVRNMLRNGKDSDVGGIFATLGMFDYVTPAYTEEMKRDLKPFTMIMGEADALVWVGYQEIFYKIFGKPRRPDEFDPNAHFQWLLLGPGKTWKTEKTDPNLIVKTGHQLADRKFESGPFEGKRQLYTWLTQWMVSIAGKEMPPLPPEDDATLKFGLAYKNAATFFGYRELIAHDTEFVQTSSSDMRELSDRLKVLNVYVNGANKVTNNAEKDLPKKLEAARNKLREQLGITDKIDEERARAELDLTKEPLTDERKAELEAYTVKVMAVDEELQAGFQDPTSEKEYADLWAQYADVLAKLPRNAGEGYYEAYRRHFVELTARKEKKLNKDLSEEAAKAETELYSRLSSLHQLVRGVDKNKETRYGTERERKLASIARPAGIADGRSASRELKLDRSPERRAKLTAFLERLPQVERAAREAVEAQVKAEIEKLKRPEGVEDVAHARLQLDKQSKIMNMAYAPTGSPAAALVERIDEAQAALERLRNGVTSDGKVLARGVQVIAKQVERLRKKRAELTKRWEGLMKAREIEGSLEFETYQVFTSPALQLYYDNQESAYDAYNKAHIAYNAKNKYLTELQTAGKLTAKAVLELTPELMSLREKFYDARDKFNDAREAAKKVEWNEAIDGNLQLSSMAVKYGVSPDVIGEAQEIARTLYGTDYVKTGKPAVTSLIQQLADDEELLESTRREIYMMERTRDEARLAYAKTMAAAGEKIPYNITAVPMFAFLDQDLNVVMDQLRNDPIKMAAFEQMRLRWEPILSEFRAVNQTKGDNASY